MNIYKVLLVDDEEEVRQAIARKLDWQALGFEMVGEAANGEEALEMLEPLQPDVIMTDIKMPFMDGLTLCRLAKQQLPGVKVAIFSGFDEFEYAKEAIKLEVEEYILKPIDAQELSKVFIRLHTALDEEITARRDVQRLQRYYMESLPLMRQQLLLELLEGRLTGAALRRKLTDYQLDFSGGPYCVALVRYEPLLQSGSTEENAPQAQLHAFSLQQLIQDALPARLPHIILPTMDRLILLFMLQNGADEHSIIAALNQLFLPAKKYLDLQLSIGVGTCGEKLEDVGASFKEAQGALEYQVLVESGQCVYIGDIEPPSGTADVWNLVDAAEVVRQIKIGQKEQLETAVQTLIHQLKAARLNLHQYQLFLLELFTELLKLIKTYKLETDSTELSDKLLEKNAHSFSNFDEMGRWLFTYCDDLRLRIRRERKDSTRLLIEKAKTLLGERYAQSSLSLESLCSEINVSPAYFSTIFKKETGLNFVSYLTQLRLEKALEYLGTTDEKTYLIAEKVGYTDANYFSYVFKKQYGVSPSKYRSSREANDDLGEKAF